MARLVVKSEGREQVIELKLGVNRLGRSPDADLQVVHSTISGFHCELELDRHELVLRDCESTNGTFVDGEPIREARLIAGQTFCAGDVEIFVESTDVNVAIPKIEVPVLKVPPVVLKNGALLCTRHPSATVTHRCTHCKEVMCEDCVTRMRRRGGKYLDLCSLCSHKVERISDKKKKKSILGFLAKTVKLPFAHTSKEVDADR
jgi:pSer/pThr/pTyr-binding forkhead associated (FHA) protein